jgi:chromosome segregation ATPase
VEAMKMSSVLVALSLMTMGHCVDETNPTTKVLELIGNLQSVMIKKGEASQSIYNEFAAWCTDRAQQLGLEIKGEKSQKKGLVAEIDSGKATIQSKDVKIDHEVEDITTSESETVKAKEVRATEEADFKEEEDELVEVIFMLKRAKSVVEKQLAGGAAFLQTANLNSIANTLKTLVEASFIADEDAAKLTSFVQSLHQSADDLELAAPAGSVYTSSSGGVVALLEDLLDKAVKELANIRGVEESEIHNYLMKRQALMDEIKFSKEDKSEAAKDKNAAAEEKAIDEGDLGMTVKDIEADVKTLADLRRVCIAKVEEFTAMAKSRDEELKALAEAKKVIKESMLGASEKAYKSAAALIQVSTYSASHAALAKQALDTVKKLASQYESSSLAQLASRITATLRSGALTGEDPFAKVVGMISDMISQLEQEAKDDANKKEYCDKELAETKTKKADHANTIEALTVKIDQNTARSNNLKDQVTKEQAALAEIASSQAEMDKIRNKENEEYSEEKSELEKGLDGVKTALTTLQKYYGKDDKDHQTRSNAASQIISLLETIEGDFSQSLAELEAGEQQSVADYEAETQDNKVASTAKEEEVSAKTKEFTALDKKIADQTNDRKSVQTELDAVEEYLKKLKKECINHMTRFEEMQERRGAEIAGLKEALNILETETSFVQTARRLRGKTQHTLA